MVLKSIFLFIALGYFATAQAQYSVLPAAAPAPAAEWDAVPAGGATPQRSVGLATGLSFFPGMGELYLDKPQKGVAYMSPWMVSALLPAQGGAAAMINGLSSHVAWESYLYSIFDTYRDARLLQRGTDYRYPISTEGFWHHCAAPYRMENVFNKYALWTAAEGAANLALFYTLIGKNEPQDPLLEGMGMAEKISLSAVLGILGYGFFTLVGVGEEGFFRGFLQGSLKESMPSPAALTVSSALFAAAHVPQVLPDSSSGSFSQASDEEKQELARVLTVRIISGFTGGLLFGWIYDQENGDLDKAIAMHTLADTLLVMAMPLLLFKVPQMSIQFTVPF